MQQDEVIDLTVVIPIYNAEAYLKRCLRSVVRALGSLSFEALLLDDGSTDQSGHIAKEFAEAHEGFHYILLSHAGQGAARNYGIKQAKGKYIQFTDADDVLLSGSLEQMVTLAERRGAEIVMQNIAALEDEKIRASGLALRCISKIPPGDCCISIEKNPMLVYGALMTDKVFLRQFLIANDIWFSEGVVFEDLFPGMRSICLAQSVAVLRTRGYYYRMHSAQTTKITDARSFFDRLAEIRRIFAFLDTQVRNPAVRKEYELIVLWGNFWLPMARAEEFGDQLGAVMDAMREILNDYISKETIERLPVLHRQLVQDIFDQDVEHFVQVSRYGQKEYPKARINHEAGRYVLQLPEEIFRIPERDASTSFYHSVPASQIRSLEVGNGSLEITGHLFQNRIELDSFDDMELHAWLVNERTGASREGALKRIKSEYLTTQRYKEEEAFNYSYDWAGFSISFDIEASFCSEEMQGKNLILMQYKTPVSHGWRVLRGIVGPVRKKLPNMQILTDVYRISMIAEPDATLALWVHSWDDDASQKAHLLFLQEKVLDLKEEVEHAAMELEKRQEQLEDALKQLEDTRIKLEGTQVSLRETQEQLKCAQADLTNIKMERARLKDKLEKIENSRAYRVGEKVIWLPKKIYRIGREARKK